MRRIFQIILIFTAFVSVMAQPTIDGTVNDAEYSTVGTFTSGRDGFGSSNTLNLLRYYQDGTTLYVGLSCDLTSNDNVIIFFNFSGYTGRTTNTIAGSSSSSVGVFTTTGGGLAGSKMDMDVDFAFAFNEGNGSTNLFLDVARFGSGTTGYIATGIEGNTSNQTGTPVSLDVTSTTGGTGANMSLAYNNAGSGGGNGIEFSIPISNFSGVTTAQTVQFFVLITNSTGFTSNECIPGDPGASNPGNNADFSAISGQDFFTSTQLMPVELTSFNANIINEGVNLLWSTATEVNNFGFAVERKSASADWNQITFVEGNGNSNAPKVYSYIDNTVDRTQNYQYRLKQIDNDGTFEYSSVVEANFAAPVNFNLSQNYPNPFNPSTKIQFTVQKNENVQLNVYSIDGEKVAALFDGAASAGVNYELNFEAGDLASGVYYYKLVSESGTQVRKMLLMK